jgi:hypothetical protein
MRQIAEMMTPEEDIRLESEAEFLKKVDELRRARLASTAKRPWRDLDEFLVLVLNQPISFAECVYDVYVIICRYCDGRDRMSPDYYLMRVIREKHQGQCR